MKLCATIIETRDIPIVDVIKGHMSFLPKGCGLKIWCRPSLVQKMEWIFPNAIVYPSEIKTHQEYNALLTSKEFWETHLGFDRVLIFQHDTTMLRSGIEEFYPYDYVGAPFFFQKCGGNGGGSLRNPRTMLAIIGMCGWRNENEDIFFSNNLCAIPHAGRMAPPEVCARFSIESVFQLGSMMAHAPEKWLTPNQVEQILNQYQNKI